MPSRILTIVFMLSIYLLVSCHQHNRQEDQHSRLYDLDSILIDSLIINLDQRTMELRAHQIDSVFNRLRKLTGFNGTVLYAEQGRVIYQQAFGYADVRYKRELLSIDSQFELASVSKMFTAVGIMLLHEEGKIDYDTDIRKYLYEWPYEGITVRLLLNHRSGLSRYESLAQDFWLNKKIPLTNDAAIQLFVKHQPQPYFKPNNGFHYCNTNYMLLSSIIERVSGLFFEDFMKQRVFKPAGMNQSFIYSMRFDSLLSTYREAGVPGYDVRGRRLVKVQNDYLNGVLGDKGMFSTVGDLYRFDLALKHQLLVSDSTLNEAYKPGSPRHRRRKDNYGFGWRIKDGVDSTVYHYGWWKGFRTFFIRDMIAQKTLIVLTNKDKGPGSEHFWKLMNDDTYQLFPASTNLKLEMEKQNSPYNPQQ